MNYTAGVPEIHLCSLDGTNVEIIKDVQEFSYDSETKKIIVQTAGIHDIPYRSYGINVHFGVYNSDGGDLKEVQKTGNFSKYYIGNLIETYANNVEAFSVNSFCMEFEVIELRS